MFSHLREDLNCILQRDPAARGWFEVSTCYPGLHAIWLHRVSHGLWVHGVRWPARVISYLARSFTGIEIHPGAIIGRRVFIDHGMGVVIGETAEVGDDCTIYQGVTLGGTSLYRGVKRHPTLGRGVVVGAGAKVLGGFTVSDGAKIGSNAVVVKPVPPGATATGIPARIIEAQTGQVAGDATSGRTSDAATEAFSAYGLSPSADDPLSIALHRLIGETADQARMLDAIVQALKERDITVDCCKEAEGPFDPERLNKLVD